VEVTLGCRHDKEVPCDLQRRKDLGGRKDHYHEVSQGQATPLILKGRIENLESPYPPKGRLEFRDHEDGQKEGGKGEVKEAGQDAELMSTLKKNNPKKEGSIESSGVKVVSWKANISRTKCLDKVEGGSRSFSRKTWEGKKPKQLRVLQIGASTTEVILHFLAEEKTAECFGRGELS